MFRACGTWTCVNSTGVRTSSSGSPGWAARAFCSSRGEMVFMISIPFQRAQHLHERIDLLPRIVKRQRGADAAFQSEMADGGLGAMVSRANGDAVLVELPGDAFVRQAGNDKGQNAGLRGGGADGAQAGNGRQRASCVLEQSV